MNFSDPIKFPEGLNPEKTDVLVRYVSTGGLWHIDVCRVFNGFRLKVGPAPQRSDHWMDHSYEVVYCMGRANLTLFTLPRMVIKILEPVEEIQSTSSHRTMNLQKVRELFPSQRIKPMHNDPVCWAALCRLAGVPDFAGVDLLAAGEIVLPDLLSQLVSGGAL